MKNLIFKRVIALLLFSSLHFISSAQSLFQDSLVYDISPSDIASLEAAPNYSQDINITEGVKFTLPDPKGNFTEYYFFKNKVLSQNMISQYPDLFTLTGYSDLKKDHYVNIVLH
ncbi:MAG TPA: hypothetical protein PJ990_10665, partial [Saprospiraceae bacterium]|nr:hypothetical protein [Saprospiraceae bacterium]